MPCHRSPRHEQRRSEALCIPFDRGPGANRADHPRPGVLQVVAKFVCSREPLPRYRAIEIDAYDSNVALAIGGEINALVLVERTEREHDPAIPKNRERVHGILGLGAIEMIFQEDLGEPLRGHPACCKAGVVHRQRLRPGLHGALELDEVEDLLLVGFVKLIEAAGEHLRGGRGLGPLEQRLDGNEEELAELLEFLCLDAAFAGFHLDNRRAPDAEEVGNVFLGQMEICPGFPDSFVQARHGALPSDRAALNALGGRLGKLFYVGNSNIAS